VDGARSWHRVKWTSGVWSISAAGAFERSTIRPCVQMAPIMEMCWLLWPLSKSRTSSRRTSPQCGSRSAFDKPPTRVDPQKSIRGMPKPLTTVRSSQMPLPSLGPDQFKPEKFTDPVVLDLIERITVEGDPSMPDHGYGGISEIVTKDGRKFQKHIVTPHGRGDDPLSDGDLEDKFREMAVKHMGEAQIQKIFDAVWNTEKLDDMNKLMRLMVFESR
jgi:hypothetical protein